MNVVSKKKPKWPVVEIFGPTIQGEGVDQGVVCHFVRFGGCDFRCNWCDTPHAVLPEEVRANAERMDAESIGLMLDSLSEQRPPWVVISGGNPALHDLTELVEQLHMLGYLVSVETQGSKWRDWMGNVDRLCCSPKPPSATAGRLRNKAERNQPSELHRFIEEGMRQRALGERDYEWFFLKVVVFDDKDLDWAEKVRKQLSDALLYLSAGNDAGRTVGNPTRKDTRTVAGVRRDLFNKARWLTEEVFKRPTLCSPDVIVQAQFHVALWGNELGR